MMTTELKLINKKISNNNWDMLFLLLFVCLFVDYIYIHLLEEWFKNKIATVQMVWASEQVRV